MKTFSMNSFSQKKNCMNNEKWRQKNAAKISFINILPCELRRFAALLLIQRNRERERVAMS